MQRYTIFFITVNALHVSGGFSAHHQELKNGTHSIWYVPSLLAATARNMQTIDNNKEYCIRLHLVCTWKNWFTETWQQHVAYVLISFVIIYDWMLTVLLVSIHDETFPQLNVV